MVKHVACGQHHTAVLVEGEQPQLSCSRSPYVNAICCNVKVVLCSVGVIISRVN